MNEVGLGVRVVNFLVDTLAVFLIAFGLYKWHSFYVTFWKFSFIPFYVFFFGTIVIYYFIFELIWSRTPGKWISLSKVRSANGKRPSLPQVLLRSVLRLTLIDPFFIPFLNRTLHDQLSNTRVVEA